MKTYHRIVKEPIRIEDGGHVFVLDKDDRVLTSAVREVKGVPSVTVFSAFWVTLPVSLFLAHAYPVDDGHPSDWHNDRLRAMDQLDAYVIKGKAP